MKKNNSSISKARSYAEIGEFWDNHDLSDFWKKTKVKFDVVLEPEATYYPIKKGLSEKIQAEACQHGVSSHTLVNLWLEQKIKEQKSTRRGRRLSAKNRFNCLGFFTAVLSIFAWLTAGLSEAQTGYYQGKTLTILRGGSPGGYGDLQARALIPYLKKYIPGEPTIIIEHKQGAAGRTAANHIYSAAKPDGLTIGAVGNVLISGPILGLPGSNYDLDKLIYLGSTESGSPTAFVTRQEAGLDNLEKLRAATGVRIGAHSVGHITYINGRLAAYLLGLKEPKFVVGYSSPERDVALLQGEVDGGSMSRATIQQNPSLMEKVYFHTVITIPKGRYVPPYSRDIPEIDSFAKSEKEHRLLSLYRAFDYPRWPYFLPPGTPKELVNILREAMAKSFNDPGFAKEFKKLTGADPSPITSEAIEAAIKELPRDPETIALYKHLADHRPMPAR